MFEETFSKMSEVFAAFRRDLRRLSPTTYKSKSIGITAINNKIVICLPAKLQSLSMTCAGAEDFHRRLGEAIKSMEK